MIWSRLFALFVGASAASMAAYGQPIPGVLNFVEVQKDDTLDGAVSVTVSPDGAHVYATGAVDDAVAVAD